MVGREKTGELYFGIEGEVYCHPMDRLYPRSIDGWYQVLVGHAFDLGLLSPKNVLKPLES
jgi:hypothetical protein